jgi:hypothetical protein
MIGDDKMTAVIKAAHLSMPSGRSAYSFPAM